MSEKKSFFKRRKKAIAYRDYPYKLIFYEGNRKYQLYDLRNDPLEKHNLVRSPSHKSILISMKKMIDNHLREIEQSKIKLKIQNLRDVKI